MQTILYITDNSLDDSIMLPCQKILLREAGDIRIVSVSQKPIAFGDNICVGEIGRSWMSLYKGLLAGLAEIGSGTVVIAEHDCLYTHEHLSYQPEFTGAFYYNANHWLVNWHSNHPEMEGMYSYWSKRTALSQLVCDVSLLRESTEEVMELLNLGLKVEKGIHWYGEPGVVSEQFRRAFIESTSGRSTQLQAYLKDYVTKYTSLFFKTKLPNLDIRHGSNFTGPKRGKHRTYDLPYWGKFAEVMA